MPTQPTIMESKESTTQPLTSIEHGCFDTAALQDELAKALEEDRKYKLTDSMKKRAIRTAASYDEFKNLVACADLKPVSQRELSSFSSTQRSTNISFKKKSRKTFGANLSFEGPTASGNVPPANAVDFRRQWRRYLRTDGEKYRYLQLATAENLGPLFKTDMDADLLADIGRVVLRSCKDATEDVANHAAFAVTALESLAATDRFALTLDFLDNNQVETLRDLFDLLEDHLDKNKKAKLGSLKEKYRL